MFDFPNTEIMEAVQERQQQATMTPDELRKRAQDAIIANQECFVAQWIIMNPFANPEDYTLKFVYHDKSLLGYDVQMVKIEK